MSGECLYVNLPLGSGNNALTELVGTVSYFWNSSVPYPFKIENKCTLHHVC
jgi:hypothetical protein